MKSSPVILFSMRYPDDEGFVWRTIALCRDLVAGHLAGFRCLIAFPKLTGRSLYRFSHLQAVELDCYDASPDGTRRMEKFMVEHGVVAAVFMSALPNTLDMKMFRRLGVKTVNTENDGFDRQMRDPWLKGIAKLVVRRIFRRQIHHLHIANSSVQAAWLHSYARIPRSRIKLVSDGVDCEHFVPSPAGVATSSAALDPAFQWCLCVSQSRPEKRVDMVIRAASEIVKRYPAKNFAFAYIGDGPMLAQWKALAQSLGLGARFRFIGQVQDPLPYYQSAHLMVHASERESFGLVLAEAMACGLPVVACRADGPSQIIDDGRTGALVDIDDERAFTDAIAHYLMHPEKMRQHGQMARVRVVDNFSIHRQAEKIATSIRHVIGSRPPAVR
jgi:glycosyltransferase involved in cell wall biosynthesis